MFEIIVTEIVRGSDGAAPTEVQRYRQCVDTIDLRGVMAAVNKRPRKSRAKTESSTSEPRRAGS